MPTRFRRRSLAGALALAALLAYTISLSAQPTPVDPLKKLDPAKNDKPKDAKDTKDAKPLVVKLPDGTFLWLGGTSDGERVTLTPQEFQKLLDRVDTLKKELARAANPPSGCAIRTRGETRRATRRNACSLHPHRKPTPLFCWRASVVPCCCRAGC